MKLANRKSRNLSPVKSFFYRVLLLGVHGPSIHYSLSFVKSTFLVKTTLTTEQNKVTRSFSTGHQLPQSEILRDDTTLDSQILEVEVRRRGRGGERRRGKTHPQELCTVKKKIKCHNNKPISTKEC